VKRHRALAQAYLIRVALLGQCSTVCYITSPATCQARHTFRNIRLTNEILADGPLGGAAQKIGGPLDKEGMVGKNFNADGKIGGMVQENLADKK